MQCLFAFRVSAHLQSSIYLLNMKMAQSAHEEKVFAFKKIFTGLTQDSFRSSFSISFAFTFKSVFK